jgi:dUTP pyrophosphatase
MTPISVPLQVLPHGEGLALPAYQTPGSAGLDFIAAVSEPLILEPGRHGLIPTGIAFALPDGWELQVRPRSGLAFKHGIAVLNAPGTIDADYRGELKILLINLGTEPFRIERGMRIAQGVLAQVHQIAWEITQELPTTSRGAGGFGHTGTQQVAP